MDHFYFLPNERLMDDKSDETEKRIPSILHMIWVGQMERPHYVQDYYQKWKELMPTWDVRLWTNEDINDEHFHETVIQLINKANKGAQKADIMRYFIIRKYGGFYVDTDVIPHQSMDRLSYLGDIILCHDLEITWSYVAIGFFGSIPHHKVIDYCCQLLETQSIPLNTEDIHMYTGPRLLGEALFQVQPDSNQKYTVLPIQTFYHNEQERDIIRFGTHFYSKCW